MSRQIKVMIVCEDSIPGSFGSVKTIFAETYISGIIASNIRRQDKKYTLGQIVLDLLTDIDNVNKERTATNG